MAKRAGKLGKSDVGKTVIYSQDLAEFRKDLRIADKAVAKEFQGDLRQIAREVAADVIAPTGRTRKLETSYRGLSSGNKAIVRSTVFYSRFIEFGFHPRGGSRFVQGTNPIGRAIERNEDKIVDAIGDAVEKAATRVGWH